MKLNFKPEDSDIEKAKNLIREGIKEAEDVLPKEKNLDFGIAWTEDRFVKQNMGGVSGMAWHPTFIELKFNSDVENWKKNVKVTTVHEFGHSWFYEKIGHNHNDQDLLIWRYILDEALTQNLVEKIYPDSVEKWALKHTAEDIKPFWEEIKKEELDRDYSYPDPLYINQSEGGYPNWLGYSMSYLIGQHLLEQGYELEDFPELEKEDVVKAGNKLFG
ncbi:MAG: hypothetical protein H8Z69_01810 [Nanohaloarchaea archaeon]|nr:hypothetical protein [Candidatus Nanohaloarchaea archaeon]